MITEILNRERRQKETQSQRCEEAVLPALKMEESHKLGNGDSLWKQEKASKQIFLQPTDTCF